IIQGPQRSNEVEFYVAHKTSPAVELGDSTEPYVFSHLHFATLTGFAGLLIRITSDEEWLRCAFDDQVIAAGKAERVELSAESFALTLNLAAADKDRSATWLQ